MNNTMSITENERLQLVASVNSACERARKLMMEDMPRIEESFDRSVDDDVDGNRSIAVSASYKISQVGGRMEVDVGIAFGTKHKSKASFLVGDPRQMKLEGIVEEEGTGESVETDNPENEHLDDGGKDVE